LPYDVTCDFYTYSSTYANIVCNKCSNDKLVTAVGDLSASPKTYTYCSTAANVPIYGCNKYVVT